MCITLRVPVDEAVDHIIKSFPLEAKAPVSTSYTDLLWTPLEEASLSLVHPRFNKNWSPDGGFFVKKHELR